MYFKNLKLLTLKTTDLTVICVLIWVIKASRYKRKTRKLAGSRSGEGGGAGCRNKYLRKCSFGL